MSDSIIKVENLSKAYRIGIKDQAHDTLGGKIGSWFKTPVKNFQQLKNLSRIRWNLLRRCSKSSLFQY